mgnify:CR=1 FL=1
MVRFHLCAVDISQYCITIPQIHVGTRLKDQRFFDHFFCEYAFPDQTAKRFLKKGGAKAHYVR